MADRAALESLLQAAAQLAQQPEIHVHADPKTRYDTVAAVLTSASARACSRVGVVGLEAYARKPYCRAVRTLVGMACAWLARKGLMSSPHGACSGRRPPT